MKHNELLPRPGRRSWTRPEDYLPPRRNRRPSNGQPLAAQLTQLSVNERNPERRMLGLIPFVALMIGLGVLAVAIALAAWPGRSTAGASQRPVAKRDTTGTTFTLDAPTHR